MTLGKRLKALREIKGWSLRHVEENSKISNGYLNLLENDKVKDPSPHILCKLAETYEVPYTELMELAGYVPPSNERKKVTGIAARIIGQLEPDELEDVLKYIEFLRSKRAPKKKRYNE
mgnify:CR=1 FL=1